MTNALAMIDETRFFRFIHSKAAAWVSLVFILAMTLVVWLFTRAMVEQRTTERFAYRADQIRQSIAARMQTYEQVLHGCVALFDASPDVSRDQWRRYVAQLELERFLPGIQATGFALMIAPADLAAHHRALRAEGFADYAITPAGLRKQYSSIVYVEPFSDRNRQTFGADMYADPARREAMERARDSGEVALSGKLTLAPEDGEAAQPGFLLYLPVYRHDQPHQSRAQRRATLRGFVYSVFRAQDLMAGMVAADARDADLEVFDGPAQAANRLFDSRLGQPRHDAGRFQVDLPIVFGGRWWTARFSSRQPFDQSAYSTLPESVAAGGSAIALLVFFILISNARHQTRMAAVTRRLRDSEARLRTLVNSLPDFVFAVDTADRLSYFHPPIARGEEFATLRGGIGRPYAEVLPAAAVAATAEAIRALQGDPTPQRFGLTLELDGEARNFDVLVSRQCDAEHQLTGYLGVARDVTEEKAIRARERLLVSALEAVGNGVVITDVESRIEWANPAFEALTGFRRDEVHQQRPADLIKSGEQSASFYEALWATILAGNVWRGELVNRRKSGEKYHAELTIAPVRDESGEIRHFVGVQHDISERKRLEAELQDLAATDALTGLPNRRRLMSRLDEELARIRRSDDYQAVVMMLDLDHFKHVNDRLGHAAGDAVLCHFSNLLRDELRKIDLAGRIGGEEFVILLPDTDLARATVFAERLRSKIQDIACPNSGQPISVTVSIGVTVMNAQDSAIDSVLARADAALYRAKTGGRNRVEMSR